LGRGERVWKIERGGVCEKKRERERERRVEKREEVAS
jgi:hypothetical protein